MRGRSCQAVISSPFHTGEDELSPQLVRQFSTDVDSHIAALKTNCREFTKKAGATPSEEA